jgi:hypothetical protein
MENAPTKKRNKGYDNLRPCKPGETHNPNGRPKGQRNYATIYREALKKIAIANEKTPEELEEMLEETGLKQALKGNFHFWKDIRDRIHGKAPEKQTTVNVNVHNEYPAAVQELTQKLNELYRGTGFRGDGKSASPVDPETQH